MTVEGLHRVIVFPEGPPGRRGFVGVVRGLQGPGPGRLRVSGRGPGLPDVR